MGRRKGSPPRPRFALGRGGLGGGRFAPAWGAEVVSSNIVGYNKVSLTPGYNLLGIQFSQVGGASLDLSDAVILDETYGGYDSNYDFKSTLRVWDPSTEKYITYGWAGTSGTTVDNDPSLDNTWTDLEAYAVEGEDLDVTQGIWIRAEKVGTALVAGEVSTDDVEISLVPGFNLVANPYPMSVKVTNFGVLDETYGGYDSNYDFKSTLRKWDPATEKYMTFGWAGTSGTAVDNDPSLDNTWTDLEAYATDVTIAPGEGVWIRAEKAGKIKFTFPKN